VERVRGVRSISSIYSIGRTAERISEGLPALIRDCGWSEDPEPSYAGVIASLNREHIGHAGLRRERSMSLLESMQKQLIVENVMSILRDHDIDAQFHAELYPSHISKRTLCAHAGAEDRPGQTVGSMVSGLRRTDAIHWVTGTAAPCTSIFKPVLMNVPLPAHGPRPTDHFEARSLWWRHEQLHRTVLMRGFTQFIDEIHQECDTLEATFHARVKAVLNGGSAADRAQVVAECWQEATNTEDRWYARVNRVFLSDDSPYHAIRLRMSRIAGMDL
jgi:secernin